MTAPQQSALREQGLVIPMGNVGQVSRARWNRLATRGFQLHRWFAVAERCGWRPRHVAVAAPGGIDAIVPAYLIASGAPNDLHDRWLGPLRTLASRAGINLRPVLSVQSPFSLVSEPLGEVDGLSDSLLHRTFETLERRAREDGAKAVVWPFVEVDHSSLLRVGRERGYAQVYSGASARLRVRWGSLDDYIASRSKSVRRTIRSDLEGMAAQGLRLTSSTDFRAQATAMDRLYRSAFRDRNGQESVLASSFFRTLAEEPSDGVIAQLTWAGDRLAGSSVNLIGPELIEGTFVGFAAEYRGGPAFFNDLVYQPLQLAFERAITEIDLGPTALYSKVLRGATLRRRVTLVRGVTPTMHRALAALGAMVARREEAKERRALGALWGPRCFEEDA
jgi:predicted N-acyltransferase